MRSASSAPASSRQLDGEHGAALRMIRGDDLPAVLLHDAVGDGQPEAGALARLLSSCRTARRCATARRRECRCRVSRTVATIAIARRRDAVVISMRPGLAGRRDRLLRVHHHVQEHLMEQQRVALHARQLLVIVSHDFDVRRRGTPSTLQRKHLLQHGVEADRRAAPAAAIRRRRAGCGRFSRRGRLRGRSSGPRARSCFGNAPVTRSSSRWPSTPCSGLFSSCAMPATNWPSAASFSDCVSRLRSSSRSASSLVCGVRSRATMHAADALAVVVEQIGRP